MPLPTSELVCCRWTCPCFRDTSLDDVQGVTRNLASAPLLWCNHNWTPCTGHSTQREDKGGCRAGGLLACGLVNPTTNRKRDEAERDHDQRTRKSPVAEGHHQAGIPSNLNPASKEMISDSVELCETEVCFLHIQLIRTNV